MTIATIPEVAGLDARRGLVRIPPELDVPLTARVRRLIDTVAFRRLAHISQLGLVSLVYPAALHTRFEHALGVYRLALVYLKQLCHDERFTAAVSVADAELFIVAALLHDIGHWPFCHPIEDIRLEDVFSHERFAERFLATGEIADALREDWGINPADVLALLSEKPRNKKDRILASLLSGPIDVDKTDYLMRDSLHAGVPYGRNFDQGRLIGSLCLNEAGDALAIGEKGKTAAEMLVFARYVMFSEVYWHHSVRAATAMLQRAFFLLRGGLDLDLIFQHTDSQFIETLRRAADGTPASDLIGGLFGPTRRLYKRVAQYSFFEQRELYERLARRPYPWLVACAERFAEKAGAALGRPIPAAAILFDAPPVGREVEFNIDVCFLKERRYRTLGEVSPVVRTLAERQFDDYVKRVRIFAAPDVADGLRSLAALPRILEEAIEGV
ncbi:MAG TPA: HD domain-containing protein [Pirellulales bacterium]